MALRARIRNIRLDASHRPLTATIFTQHGLLRVHWLEVYGDWCWFHLGLTRRPTLGRYSEVMCAVLG